MDPKIVIKFQNASFVLIIPNFLLTLLYCPFRDMSMAFHSVLWSHTPLTDRGIVGYRDAFFPSRSNFFQFHAIFGKNGQNKKLASLPLRLVRPPHPPPPLVWLLLDPPFASYAVTGLNVQRLSWTQCKSCKSIVVFLKSRTTQNQDSQTKIQPRIKMILKSSTPRIRILNSRIKILPHCRRSVQVCLRTTQVCLRLVVESFVVQICSFSCRYAVFCSGFATYCSIFAVFWVDG